MKKLIIVCMAVFTLSACSISIGVNQEPKQVSIKLYDEWVDVEAVNIIRYSDSNIKVTLSTGETYSVHPMNLIIKGK